MAKLFYPDAERLRGLGFESVADVPTLFDRAERYCRAHNRYLRERALGEAGLGRPAPWDAENVPSAKTVENIARHLGVFVDWCDHHNVDWRKIDYKNGILRYQNDMALGRWSLSGRKVSPRTANHRADEATAFLAWAADRGLRPAFEVKYKVVKRPTGTKLPGLLAEELAIEIDIAAALVDTVPPTGLFSGIASGFNGQGKGDFQQDGPRYW